VSGTLHITRPTTTLHHLRMNSCCRSIVALRVLVEKIILSSRHNGVVGRDVSRHASATDLKGYSMKSFTTIAVGLITLFSLFGCASTKMTSFKDPAFQSVSFKRILVVANTSDLEWRRKIEARMVQAFREVGVFAIEGVQLFPPTRELTDDEKVNILLQNNIDAYVSVSVGESGVKEVYVPPTGSTTKTEGKVRVSGNQADYEEKSTTRIHGGYTLSKPWADFETKLFDVSSGQNAWLASSHTGGNAYANFNTVINSYCDKVVEQILEDGLITRSSK
jgi:hypothetical protein